LAEKNAKFLSSLKRRLRQKFVISAATINAADFGVPQKRLRFFMAGVRRQENSATIAFDFPKGSSTHVTAREAIGHLPDATLFNRNLTPDDISYHPNHWTMQPKSIRFKSPLDKPLRNGRCFIRLEWDKPSRTVAYGHREIHIHPNGHRRLSIYEAMLLQGFPSGYQLVGNLSQQVTQVSNAVPPPLAYALAEKIKADLGFSSTDRIKKLEYANG